MTCHEARLAARCGSIECLALDGCPTRRTGALGQPIDFGEVERLAARRWLARVIAIGAFVLVGGLFAMGGC